MQSSQQLIPREITIPFSRGIYLLSDITHQWNFTQRKYDCFRRYYIGESDNCGQRLIGHWGEGRLNVYARMVLLVATKSTGPRAKRNRLKLELRFMAAALAMGLDLPLNGKNTLPRKEVVERLGDLRQETKLLEEALKLLAIPGLDSCTHRCPCLVYESPEHQTSKAVNQ